jgi:hypothetical protein
MTDTTSRYAGCRIVVSERPAGWGLVDEDDSWLATTPDSRIVDLWIANGAVPEWDEET